MSLQDQINELCTITQGKHTYTCASYVVITLPNGKEITLHGWAIRNYLRMNNAIIETVQRRIDQAQAQQNETPTLKLNREQVKKINTPQAARAAFNALFTEGK